MIYALIALTVALATYAGYASARWRYWRIETLATRHLYLESLKTPPVQFIRPLPVPDLAEQFAEIDRLRAEMMDATGVDLAGAENVIHVSFPRRSQ